MNTEIMKLFNQKNAIRILILKKNHWYTIRGSSQDEAMM